MSASIRLRCAYENTDKNSSAAIYLTGTSFEDLHTLVDFLATQIPLTESCTVELSE